MVVLEQASQGRREHCEPLAQIGAPSRRAEACVVGEVKVLFRHIRQACLLKELESRMRENRLSGSEGGQAKPIVSPYPYCISRPWRLTVRVIFLCLSVYLRNLWIDT